MITCTAWAGKRYGVLGLARSGAATVAALVASGASVVAWDADEAQRAPFLSELARGGGPSRSDGGGAVRSTGFAGPSTTGYAGGPPPRGNFGEDVTIADLDAIDLATLDALVLSPGVPLNTHPLAARARMAGIPIIGDIELFAQARAELPTHKVVGITGTNGKSTVTALVHHILRCAGVPSLMGGNIGLPILAQEPLPAGGVYVLELSSYQLDLTWTLDCDVAVLTNITPDHLDRYDGFEAYAASKARLFETQSDGSVGVIGFDSPETQRLFFDLGRRRPGAVSSRSGGELTEKWIWHEPENEFYDVPPTQQADWPALAGWHNAANAILALEVARRLTIDVAIIAVAFRTFPGLPHRTERVGEVAGVAYVNDSKATNPESAAPALAAYPRVHWIVGGRAKGDDLDACRPAFPHVVRAYTIGEAGPRFAAVLAPDLSVTQCGTLDVAVREAAGRAQPGDTVLLSPAAASFDQFRDFEHRGDAFRALVQGLAA